jgi:hypothetical protein
MRGAAPTFPEDIRRDIVSALALLRVKASFQQTVPDEMLLKTRETLDKYVKQILINESQLALIAGRSYMHDNGFAKIVLFQSAGNLSEIRLHLWSKRLSDFANTFHSNVHNHSADFVSLVLVGSLVEERYIQRRLEPSAVFKKYVCGSRQERSSYEMREVGDRVLSLRLRRTLKEGTWYGLRHHQLHRDIDWSINTCTLFCQGPREQSGTIAFSPPSIKWPKLVSSMPYSPSDIRNLLQRYLKYTQPC